MLEILRPYRPVEIAVEMEGAGTWHGPAAGIVASNDACFGGDMRIALGAKTADGALDLMRLGAFSRAELLPWLPTIYWGGHLRSAKVARARVQQARISAGAARRVQLDGEVCAVTPLEVSVRAGALRLRA